MNVGQLREMLAEFPPDKRIFLRLPDGISPLAGVHVRPYLTGSGVVSEPDDTHSYAGMERVIVLNPYKVRDTIRRGRVGD